MLAKNIIQTDGQYAGQRDPPGQFTTYIPSGDPWKESYRAVTFRGFPKDTPVTPTSLANSGFFYTGYKDRVKCFSCGSSVQDWIVGDDPKERKWHRNDCDFANGCDRTNEPILRIFKQYVAPSPVLPRRSRSTSRQTDLYFSGATNSFQNRSYSPPAPSTAESSMDEEYPCLYPVNPHMRSPAARLDTFKPTPRVRWPRERLRAGINEVTNAGFFYLGERDRVKCWYCNGGLQNWDYDDDPWTEHAKWFPSCEFLLRVKGPAFVQNIVDQYPNINRPTPTVRVVRCLRNYQSPPPSTNDIQQPQSTEAVVENAMKDRTYVAQAKHMGFSEDDIKVVLTRKHNSDGRLFGTVEEFFDDMTSYQPESQRQASQSHDPSSPRWPSPMQPTSEEASNNSMLSELRSMEQSRSCKICLREPSEVVPITCGHLACCSNCSTAELRRCPACHRGIKEKIKAFRKQDLNGRLFGTVNEFFDASTGHQQQQQQQPQPARPQTPATHPPLSSSPMQRPLNPTTRQTSNNSVMSASKHSASNDGSAMISMNSGEHAQQNVSDPRSNGTNCPPISLNSQHWMNEEYPCLSPVNPHMRCLVARLKTFEQTPRLNGLRERPRVPISYAARAGFFYLSERDRVKCWYCNGILENWNYDEDPSIAHAKWFPSCEFLLRVKGPTFVQNIFDQYRNIKRPTPTFRILSSQSNDPLLSPLSNDLQLFLGTEEAIQRSAMRNKSYVAEGNGIWFDEKEIKADVTIADDLNLGIQNRRFDDPSWTTNLNCFTQSNITRTSRPNVNRSVVLSSNRLPPFERRGLLIIEFRGVAWELICSVYQNISQILRWIYFRFLA